jgi:hypothetical protein
VVTVGPDVGIEGPQGPSGPTGPVVPAGPGCWNVSKRRQAAWMPSDPGRA